MGDENLNIVDQKDQAAPAVDDTQPDVPPVQKAVQPPEIQLNVDPAVAMNLTVQEFDKKIAEAEAVVADLKKQKAAYIYDTNVQALIAAAKQQQQGEGASEEAPKPEGTQ